MSFELEIFPTSGGKLVINDLIDILNNAEKDIEAGNLSNFKIESVYKNREINYNKEILVDEDYKITFNNKSIYFFSIIENDDVFDEFDILKGYNGQKISEEFLKEASLLWKNVGYSLNLELKSEKDEADFKLFVLFSIRLAERNDGLICIKENFKDLDAGLYRPNSLE